MFLLQVLALKLILDGSESVIDLHLALGLGLDLLLLGLGVLVRVLHAQLGQEYLNIELIADLLAVK